MITELTSEQEALMPVYREKWKSVIFSTEPIDRQKAVAAVKFAYVLINKEEPYIIFFDSPFAALKKLCSEYKLRSTKLLLQLTDELWTQVRSQLDFYLWDFILSELRGIDNDVDVRKAVFDFEEVGNVLQDALWNTIEEYKVTWEDQSVITDDYYLPFLWAGDASIYDFCISVLNCKVNQAKWTAFQSLVKNCGWILPFENICLVCDRPRILSFDSQKHLHAEGKPAIQFADGFSVYAYHGVTLPEKYGKLHPNQWEAKWLLEEKNAELRRVLIQGIGYSRICQELQAQELDNWQEYTLLKIDNDVDVESIYVLKMTCPSTGYIHALRVPPDINSAREAICWVNWGTDPEEFCVQT